MEERQRRNELQKIAERTVTAPTGSREQYDRLWAATWGDMQRFGPVHRHQRNQLLKLVARLSVQTVLDVGCGSGDNLAALAGAFPSMALSGTDVSAEALSLAAKRLPGVALHELDAQHHTLNERFDLVMSIQVIEHLADDVSALRNMGLMAKDWVVVTSMSGRMRPSEATIGHYRNYTDEDLRAKAVEADLDVIDIFGWGFPFYSPLFRTVAEWLPGGPPRGNVSSKQQLIANTLFNLYRLNIPRWGDVVTMIARPRGPKCTV